MNPRHSLRDRRGKFKRASSLENDVRVRRNIPRKPQGDTSTNHLYSPASGYERRFALAGVTVVSAGAGMLVAYVGSTSGLGAGVATAIFCVPVATLFMLPFLTSARTDNHDANPRQHTSGLSH